MSLEEHYKNQIEELAKFLLESERNRVREGESAVECAIRLIRTRRPKIRGRRKLRLFGFSKLLEGMRNLERDHGEELCLDVLPDGSGRIMEWGSGAELFWFETPQQLFSRLNIKVKREELFHDPDGSN